MLLQVCREVKNFFNISEESGDFKIENGTIQVKGKYLVGQYIALTGSIMNNGIYRIESFENGVISFVIDDVVYPAWVQPTGGHDAYSIGDRVTHQGDRFTSLINANIWEPGSDPRWWEHLYDSPIEHITTNEEWFGTIYGLAIPRDFLQLTDEIQSFVDSPAGQPSLIVSRSFGIESVTRATDSNGAVASWKEIFRSRLHIYRRMFSDINI